MVPGHRISCLGLRCLRRLNTPRLRQSTVFSRSVQVSATPSTTALEHPTDLSEYTQSIPKLSGAGPFPADVQFEVLGAPYSLLSVSLPASSTMYTRRGTLVGVNGKVENALSTLTLQKPLRNAMLRIPFIYQKVTSTSPLTCLISTNNPVSSFAVVKLDGAVDWIVAQRDGLLAWTGQNLTVTPRADRHMSITNMGTSRISGRGLAALVGKGQVYHILLREGEQFIVHPKNLVAYSYNTANPPRPYRLKYSALRFQLPKMNLNVSSILPEAKFITNMKKTDAWKFLVARITDFKVWSRRTIWGDRLFLRFHGPVSILVQSRASRLSDVLSTREIRDLATADPSEVPEMMQGISGRITEVVDDVVVPEGKHAKKQVVKKAQNSNMHDGYTKVAIINRGKVEFVDSDFKEFTRP